MSERHNIEWKTQWHDDYLKWVCGFANAVGGTIFIGKDDSGQVVHVPNYQRLLEDLPNKIRNVMGIICDVQLLEEGKKKYIAIHVQPYSVPVSLRGRYYYRSGSVKTELTGVELNEFLLKKAGKTWDDVIEERATVADIGEESIQQFIADSQEKGRLPDVKGLSALDFLNKLHLASGSAIKRAAVILFGKEPAKFYPNVMVKIGRFGKDATDLRFQEVLEGNLVFLLHEVLKQLDYKFLVRPVRFEGMQRLEEREYPEAALREMLLNALVHRAYMGAPIQMRVFDNRLSIWNEGALPVGLDVEQLKQEHNSKPRNPILADACFKAGYIDSWGRGILKIINACIEHGLPEPNFTEKNGGVEITLFKVSNQEGNQESNQESNQEGKSENIFTLIPKFKPEVVAKIQSLFHPSPSKEEVEKYGHELIDLTDSQIEILEFCESARKRKEILEDALGISNQFKNFKTNIEPLIERGLVQYMLPDNPTSKNQKYYTTVKGRIVLKIHQFQQGEI